MDLSQLVDANKLGGWTRAIVAALLSVAISKWPTLSPYMTPEVQLALGILVSSGVVGIWSTLTKTDAAKLKQVEAMPEVKQIVVDSSAPTTAAAKAADDLSRPKVIEQ